jgi:hypothetical protein
MTGSGPGIKKADQHRRGLSMANGGAMCSIHGAR